MGERTPLALVDAPGLGPHGGRRSDHQHRRRADRRARATSSSPRTGWPRPAIPARTRRSTTRCARSRSSSARSSGIAIPVGKDSLSMKTTWDGGRRDERGDGAAVAHRLRLRAGDRRAAHAHAAVADRRRRDRARADRSRRAAEPARRLRARAGLRAARQRRSRRRRSRGAESVLRGDPVPQSGGAAARVPRSLRRRTLRVRVRDDVRRALRRDAQPRPPRLRSASARRRRQRAPARAHAGA